jgi:hypothetical protein
MRKETCADILRAEKRELDSGPQTIVNGTAYNNDYVTSLGFRQLQLMAIPAWG